MKHNNRYIALISKLLVIIIKLQLSIIEKSNKGMTLSSQDYDKIQKLKEIIEELEELDTIPENYGK